MQILIHNRIRQIAYRSFNDRKYLYARLEPGARLYHTYTDCRDAVNPVADAAMLSHVLPKLLEFLVAQIEVNVQQSREKKDLGISQLRVMFEDIIQINTKP